VIDALAAGSVVFERAISQASSTLPSHRALFQSRLASRTRQGAPTLAEALRAAGFRTAAFTGGGNVSARFGFGRGFEVYDEDRGGLAASLPKARRWLREHADEPFFLFLHSYDIHLPYDPPPPFDAMFGGDYRGPVDGRSTRPLLRGVRRLEGGSPEGAARLTAADRARIVDLYDGGIRYTDGLVAHVLGLVEALGIAGSTTVVLYSDHGEELWDHASVIHSHSVYDELVHVPLIWRIPGLAPRRVTQQVRLIDVAPTLLEVLGVSQPPSFEGHSLVALMSGEAGAGGDRPAVSEMNRSSSLTVWPWKLVVEPPATRLFDLAADPGEQSDLASREPARVRELAQALERAIGSERARPVEATEPDGLDAEMTRRLRELGYLD